MGHYQAPGNEQKDWPHSAPGHGQIGVYFATIRPLVRDYKGVNWATITPLVRDNKGYIGTQSDPGKEQQAGATFRPQFMDKEGHNKTPVDGQIVVHNPTYPLRIDILDFRFFDFLQSPKPLQLSLLLLLRLAVVELPRGGAELEVLLVLALPAIHNPMTF